MAAAGNGFSIFPLGDSAVLAEFGTRLDLDVNARLQRLAEAVRAKDVPWIGDIVPAPGPYTLSGRLLSNPAYPDRWAITEALLPVVRA